MKKLDAERLSLYLVTDHTLSLGRRTETIVAEAIRGGVRTVQLRDKGRPVLELLEIGKNIKNMVQGTGTLFLVNDRVDLALALDCDGVHLGQNDFPIFETRRLLGPDKIIGSSISTVEQALEAVSQGADYLALNGIFATATKNDLGPPLGLDFIRLVRTLVSCPLVGIGGIKVENAGEVIRAGCDGIAVVTAITQAHNIPDVCARLLEAIISAVQNSGSG